MWEWFLIGFVSLVVFLGLVYLLLKEEWVNAIATSDEVTVGEVTKLFWIVVGFIILGPVTTIILLWVLSDLLLKSNVVIYKRKSDE